MKYFLYQITHLFVYVLVNPRKFMFAEEISCRIVKLSVAFISWR